VSPDTQRTSSAGTGEAPPGRSRGLIWRGLLAGFLIMLMTAGAVSAAGLLQVEDILDELRAQGRAAIEIPDLDRAEAGKAQTLMILGSDYRYGDREAGIKPRSDTIILVRLDPDKEVIAMTSIPRDLLVEIPGVGSSVKINTAYETGGERATVKVVKRLLSIDGKPFPINHVVTVDFSGFRKAIDFIGCVYVDIDRDYFNDQGGPGGYAVIDIDPGYQKLCGKDALAYVRYRHGDNDLVRGARQQDFLRQVRTAKGTKELMSGGFAPGNLKKLARVFGRYFDRDKTLDNKKEVFKFAKTVLFTAEKPVREVRFRVTDAPDRVNLVASEEMLRKTVSEFMNAKASETAREQTEPTAADIAASKERAKRRKNKPADIKGLEEARAEGENQAIVGARKIDFPFYFPTLRTSTAAYQGQEPRTYTIRDEQRKKHDAYRLVLAKGVIGEYYGIQGMTWRHPPILDDPHETIVRDGRKLMVYRDGKRIRLVAWRTRKAVYWVSNTLTQSLNNQQMLGIATSLKRLRGGG
jgi:polyisoprenyl-teichoic acid--peptidoglycan teichoic acid transferase